MVAIFKILEMKKAPEPLPIKAGDRRVLLGIFARPPKVDCRVVAEELYQEMKNALKKSGDYDKIIEAHKFSKSQKQLNYP